MCVVQLRCDGNEIATILNSETCKNNKTVLERPWTAVQKVKLKSKLSPINGIIRDEKIFRARYILYMQRKCRVKCVKDVTYVNAVYQLTCNSCDQQYIGNTTGFIHDRVREHLNNKNSSVKKHIYSCQNKDYKGIDVKIIMSENDPANLRLYEAFYIRKCKPTLNSREECNEFADLLF